MTTGAVICGSFVVRLIRYGGVPGSANLITSASFTASAARIAPRSEPVPALWVFVTTKVAAPAGLAVPRHASTRTTSETARAGTRMEPPQGVVKQGEKARRERTRSYLDPETRQQIRGREPRGPSRRGRRARRRMTS